MRWLYWIAYKKCVGGVTFPNVIVTTTIELSHVFLLALWNKSMRTPLKTSWNKKKDKDEEVNESTGSAWNILLILIFSFHCRISYISYIWFIARFSFESRETWPDILRLTSAHVFLFCMSDCHFLVASFKSSSI